MKMPPAAALLVVLSAGTWSAAPAAGELVRFDATLEARTQEFVAGEPVSFDESFEEFLVTSTELPIRVIAQLVLPTEDESLVAASQGFADFYEPTIPPDGNPEELALEVNCFSIAPAVSYEVRAVAIEERLIRFSEDELGSGPQVERDVESSVYLSGAVIVWSQDGARDLTGLDAEMTFTVEQSGDGDTGGTEVFRAAVRLEGGPGGQISASVDGEIDLLFGPFETVYPEGDRDAGLAEAFSVLGDVHLLLIPEQDLRYVYSARAGEEFELRAAFTAAAANLPGGTGVSAVFGRGFEGLADLLSEAFDSSAADDIEAGVNRAQLAAQSSHDGESPAVRRTTGGACGALGIEAPLFGSLVLAPFVMRRTGRRPG